MKYFIIGPRSVGKSTVGNLLAKRLNLEYYDFDEVVEDKIGDIDKFCEKNSVEAYRIRESDILKKFLEKLSGEFVISLGGGTMASQFNELNKINYDLIKNIGKIIYLSPSNNEEEAIKILNEREIKRKGNKDFEETKKLLSLRKPIFEKIANIAIEVNNLSPENIVEVITKNL